MKTKDFSFSLPPELIAQNPLKERDHSRMFVLDRNEKERCRHATFSDFIAYIKSGDRVVFNETKVINARLFGKKKHTGGKVEFLFVSEKAPNVWQVFIKASRRPKPGEEIIIAENAAVITLQEQGSSGRAG